MTKVVTFGVFDYFHYGHLKLFERAKAMGDYLIVAIQAEEYILKYKPDAQILYTQDQRMELINALEKEAIKFTENKVPIHSKRMAIEMEQGSVRVKSLESLNAGIKSPDKEPDLNIETHVSDGPVSKDVLKLLDTVNIQDVKKSVKKTLGQTSIMTIGQIINSNVIRYGLEEVVAYVRVAKEYNDETVTENEDILIKAKDHTGAVKTLKISLPKIMLSSQMIRNKEEGKYGS